MLDELPEVGVDRLPGTGPREMPSQWLYLLVLSLEPQPQHGNA